ncbi:hypothetical protein vseg_008858 [Gypsophila vaccaria]
MSWGGGDSSGPGVKLDRKPDSGGDPSWRTNADTHKMSPDQVKAAGVESSRRPPGHNPGEVLHQRGRLPFKVPTMALAGCAVAGLIGYGVFYSKKKAEVDDIDAARVVTNTATPENTPKK